MPVPRPFHVVARMLVAALSVTVAAACADTPDTTLEPEISLSKPGNGRGGGPPPVNPSVDMTLAGGLDVSGDGSNDYISGECGVVGTIWEGGTEDVTLTPGGAWDPGLGCDERFIVVDLTHGTAGEDFGIGTAHHFAAINLNDAVPDDGAWHAIPAQFLGAECGVLRFDAGDTQWTKVNPGAPWTSDNARAMRLAHPTDPSKRAWQVEAQPDDPDGARNDVATCFHAGKGNKRVLDGFFNVSFSVLIVEQ